MSSSRQDRPVSRRRLLRVGIPLLGASLLAVPGFTWYATGMEPEWLEVVRVRVPLPEPSPSLSGLTIALISDVHLGPWVGAKQLRGAVDAILRARPALIAVTGDHLSGLDDGEPETLAREYSRLSAPLGVYAVLGNHDHWQGAEETAAALAAGGVTLLRNAHRPLPVNGDALYIAGVDDVWEGLHSLPRALEGVPENGQVILLAHEPDFADEVALDRRVILQLSGHSHGGQVRLPGWGPLVLPRLGRKYPEGLRQVGRLRLYTNRGIGVIPPPVRFNCRPEVTLLELSSG